MKMNSQLRKKIQLVIFDLDGVLVDACEWHYESLNRALLDVKKFQINREDHMKNFNGLPTKSKLEILKRRVLIAENDVDKIWKAKQSYTVDVIRENSLHDDTKVKMLKGLSDMGYRVACVTNSIRETAELMLEKTGQKRWLELILSNEDVNNPKPDPEGYQRAMEYFSCSPENTLILEDSERGLAAAKGSGANFYKVESPDDLDLMYLVNKIVLAEKS